MSRVTRLVLGNPGRVGVRGPGCVGGVQVIGETNSEVTDPPDVGGLGGLEVA